MGRIEKDDRPGGRCPICQAPSDAVYKPFCSARCADIDLSRWLRGAYTIPVQSVDDDEDGEGGNSGDDKGRA